METNINHNNDNNNNIQFDLQYFNINNLDEIKLFDYFKTIDNNINFLIKILKRYPNYINYLLNYNNNSDKNNDNNNKNELFLINLFQYFLNNQNIDNSLFELFYNIIFYNKFNKEFSFKIIQLILNYLENQNSSTYNFYLLFIIIELNSNSNINSNLNEIDFKKEYKNIYLNKCCTNNINSNSNNSSNNNNNNSNIDIFIPFLNNNNYINYLLYLSNEIGSGDSDNGIDWILLMILIDYQKQHVHQIKQRELFQKTFKIQLIEAICKNKQLFLQGNKNKNENLYQFKCIISELLENGVFNFTLFSQFISENLKTKLPKKLANLFQQLDIYKSVPIVLEFKKLVGIKLIDIPTFLLEYCKCLINNHNNNNNNNNNNNSNNLSNRSNNNSEISIFNSVINNSNSTINHIHCNNNNNNNEILINKLGRLFRIECDVNNQSSDVLFKLYNNIYELNPRLISSISLIDLFYNINQQPVKFKFIKEKLLKTLILNLPIESINQFIYPHFSNECNQFIIYNFKLNLYNRINSINNSINNNNNNNNNNNKSLPYYLIKNILFFLLNGFGNNQITMKNKLEISTVCKRFYQMTTTLVNDSIICPVEINCNNGAFSDYQFKLYFLNCKFPLLLINKVLYLSINFRSNQNQHHHQQQSDTTTTTTRITTEEPSIKYLLSIFKSIQILKINQIQLNQLNEINQLFLINQQLQQQQQQQQLDQQHNQEIISNSLKKLIIKDNHENIEFLMPTLKLLSKFILIELEIDQYNPNLYSTDGFSTNDQIIIKSIETDFSVFLQYYFNPMNALKSTTHLYLKDCCEKEISNEFYNHHQQQQQQQQQQLSITTSNIKSFKFDFMLQDCTSMKYFLDNIGLISKQVEILEFNFDLNFIVESPVDNFSRIFERVSRKIQFSNVKRIFIDFSSSLFIDFEKVNLFSFIPDDSLFSLNYKSFIRNHNFFKQHEQDDSYFKSEIFIQNNQNQISKTIKVKHFVNNNDDDGCGGCENNTGSENNNRSLEKPLNLKNTSSSCCMKKTKCNKRIFDEI